MKRRAAVAVAAFCDRRTKSQPTATGGHKPPLQHCAFTLVELVVVIGLIIALTVGGAVALGGRGSEGMALANSQRIVAGLLGAARAQAALHQAPARLIVYANVPPATNADAGKYLRTLQVVREDPVGSDRYVAVGDPVTLPAPICVVPPSPVPATHLALPAGQTWNQNLATGPVSTLTVRPSFSYRGHANASQTQYFGAATQTGRVLFLEFGPDGTVSSNLSNNPTKIALATAILGGNVLPRFNNARGVRGLLVRKSGALAMVDDATSF